jgi:hypothetical protein
VYEACGPVNYPAARAKQHLYNDLGLETIATVVAIIYWFKDQKPIISF